MRSRLHPTVVFLGLVSLLTDASGEMIYPLLPLFLTTVLHSSVLSIGIIEGAAESTAALLKIVSGRMSDRLSRRKPLVVFGYGLASLLRPLVGLAHGVTTVFLIRIGDRIGKGVRSSPRDALVADVTPSELRGRAYGLHQGMDNAGAVLGPLFAFVLLRYGIGLRQVFLLAAVPGLLAFLTLLFLVREPPRPVAAATPGTAQQANQPAAPMPATLLRYFTALAVFSLGNSSDAFLIVWAQDAGVLATHIPLLWMLHNGLKAVLNVPMGALSDRLGRRRVILGGWVLYALTYLGFATLHSPGAAWVLYAVYAVYYALLEGAEKAMVADLAPPSARGRAFGWFNGIIGLCALPASLLCSLLYRGGEAHGAHHGPLWAFGAGAVLAGLASLLLLLTVPEPSRRS